MIVEGVLNMPQSDCALGHALEAGRPRQGRRRVARRMVVIVRPTCTYFRKTEGFTNLWAKQLP